MECKQLKDFELEFFHEIFREMKEDREIPEHRLGDYIMENWELIKQENNFTEEEKIWKQV